MLLLDPGTICMPKILMHKTLIFVFQGPSGVRKICLSEVGRNTLNRNDQSTIFKLRTQHIPLDKHLNRIRVIAEKTCPLYNHPMVFCY